MENITFRLRRDYVNISAMMGKQAAQLQQTLSLNLLKSQMATQAAHATVMLEDMENSQPAQAPHPTLGNSVDLSV